MVSLKSLALLLASSTALADISATNKYIVTLKSGISKRDADAHLSWARSVHARSEGASDSSGVLKTFLLSDFVAYVGDFDNSTLDRIINSPQVDSVEEDTEWELHNIAKPRLDFKKRDRKSPRNDGGSSWRLDTDETEASKAKRNDGGSAWRLDDDSTEVSRRNDGGSSWRLDEEKGGTATSKAKRGDEGSAWRLDQEDTAASKGKRGDEGSSWRLDGGHDQNHPPHKRNDGGSAWRLDTPNSPTSKVKRNDGGSAWRLSTSEGIVVDVTQSEITQDTPGTSTQHNAPWGLATLSNKDSGGSSYTYPSDAGLNTFAYVIDTGVNGNHEDFEGRVEFGYSVSGDNGADEVGHGTFVAALITGKQSGVSKNSRVVSVKAFANKSASLSTLIEAYVWAVNDIIAKNRTTMSVINLSVGGRYSSIFNSLVDRAYDNGIVNVVSAGNAGTDVSNFSPASSTSAITVAAVDSTWATWEDSNSGSLVDVWAAGVDIVSADFASPTGYRSMNGTSMAAPTVAGLVLNLKSNSNVTTPDDITAAIKRLALKDVISPFTAANGTINSLVNSGIWS